MTFFPRLNDVLLLSLSLSLSLSLLVVVVLVLLLLLLLFLSFSNFKSKMGGRSSVLLLARIFVSVVFEKY